MKKLLLLLISLLLSFNSYGEWTKITEQENGDYYFVDFDKVKFVDGNVYWWDMYDAVEPYYYLDEDELYFSQQSYSQGDCQINRYKVLSNLYYSKPMGEDLIFNWNEPEPQWDYFPPESVGAYEFELVCLLAERLEANYDEQREQIIEDFKISVEYTSIINRKSKVAKVEDEELLVIDDQQTILRNAYLSNVSARVKSYWRYQGAEDDWECEVYVVQDRDGTVVAVDVRNCNVGDSNRAKAFKDSVRRAVYKASPLPSAPDEVVFDKELVMKFSVN